MRFFSRCVSTVDAVFWPRSPCRTRWIHVAVEREVMGVRAREYFGGSVRVPQINGSLLPPPLSPRLRPWAVETHAIDGVAGKCCRVSCLSKG